MFYPIPCYSEQCSKRFLCTSWRFCLQILQLLFFAEWGTTSKGKNLLPLWLQIAWVVTCSTGQYKPHHMKICQGFFYYCRYRLAWANVQVKKSHLGILFGKLRVHGSHILRVKAVMCSLIWYHAGCRFFHNAALIDLPFT